MGKAFFNIASTSLIDSLVIRIHQSSCLALTFAPVTSWIACSGMTLSTWSIRRKRSFTLYWIKWRYLIQFLRGTLHVIRTIHRMDCRQHYRGCSQHGVWWLIVRVVCLYRSQARRPNDLYLHAPTQSPVKSLRPSLLVVCPLQNSTYNQT
jgi:hypothetical protein